MLAAGSIILSPVLPKMGFERFFGAISPSPRGPKAQNEGEERGLTLRVRLEPDKIQHPSLPCSSTPQKFKAELIHGVTKEQDRGAPGCQERLQPFKSLPGLGSGVQGGIPIPSNPSLNHQPRWRAPGAR